MWSVDHISSSKLAEGELLTSLRLNSQKSSQSQQSMPKVCYQALPWWISLSPRYWDSCTCQETLFPIHLVRLLRTQKSPVSGGTRQREKRKNAWILPIGVVYQIAINHNQLEGKGFPISAKHRSKPVTFQTKPINIITILTSSLSNQYFC